jgi:hypothetical protein
MRLPGGSGEARSPSAELTANIQQKSASIEAAIKSGASR